MKLLFLLSATAIGVAFALQPAINGAAAKSLGSPVSAATISVAITLFACFALMPLFGGLPKAQDVLALPWWIIFGGLIGAGVVAGGAAIAPVTGAAAFFVCMIAGQLFGSALVDHFGAFGLPQQSLSPARLAGLALVLAGVLLIQFERA